MRLLYRRNMLAVISFGNLDPQITLFAIAGLVGV